MSKLFSLLEVPLAIHCTENYFFPEYTGIKDQIVRVRPGDRRGPHDSRAASALVDPGRFATGARPVRLRIRERRIHDAGFNRPRRRVLRLRTPTDSLLERIANAGAPEAAVRGLSAAALPIDTGALITGLSNLQVARRLLDVGLSWCDGVVFLDELDRKMILLRKTGRVVRLEISGVPATKRFAFYDQVHTTGMDIKHFDAAVAALTLGKDSKHGIIASLFPPSPAFIFVFFFSRNF